MPLIKIIIIDDHEMVREGIKFILGDHDKIKIIDEFSDGIYLNHHTESLKQADIVLMDINMPKRDGVQTTAWLSEAFPNIRVIALTLEQDIQNINKIMEAGASGYVLKNTPKAAFIDAVNTVLKGHKYFSNEIAQLITQAQFQTTKAPDLSDREMEVLHLVADGYTNQEIADKLFISPRTVDTHRKNLIEKMSAKNTAHLVKLSAKKGFFD
ncbi:MAG: response regulator transcription factor [Flavobacteriales bacterium]|nr:response regulator transcription factor [Flavobacteriales bacterium]